MSKLEIMFKECKREIAREENYKEVKKEAVMDRIL
jgi:hypothetical protein